jgi:hypothetical protein
MENIKKIKRSALVLLVIVTLILLYNIILAGWAVLNGYALPAGEFLNPAKIVIDVIRVLIVLSILICAMVLLRSIKKDESPFNFSNVKFLKRIAILIAILDPFEIIASMIPVSFGGYNVTTFFLPSGCFFVAGIVVYCVSLVFEYGISLQKQYDETL